MNATPARKPAKIMAPGLSLASGDRLPRDEFHCRYQSYADDVKFELVGGMVFMASPLRRPHAVYEEELSFLLGLYRRSTPGVELLPNATIILEPDSELQPDLALRLLPDYGGQSQETEEHYIAGGPELIAEIAHSSRALDMYEKRDAYQAGGVQEYLVLCLEEQELHWFHFPSAATLRPNRQGMLRSRIFPGLWLDGQALLARDSARLIEVVQQGLASREHVRFVKRLEKIKKARPAQE